MGDCVLSCPSSESVRLINKTGIPLSADSADRLWSRVRRRHPEGKSVEKLIRNCLTLTPPAVPRHPVFSATTPPSLATTQLQCYLMLLEYNHTGMQYFEVNKSRPISRLLETAKDILRESLPIKCLEAVILSIYLLSPIDTLRMFVVGFKSEFKTQTHRHVILGVYCDGKYGTVGLSRRRELMYKSMKYQTLNDLLLEFIQSYQDCGHSVVKIDLSNRITHDVCSCEVIRWKFISIVLRESETDSFKRQLEKYSHLLKN